MGARDRGQRRLQHGRRVRSTVSEAPDRAEWSSRQPLGGRPSVYIGRLLVQDGAGERLREIAEGQGVKFKPFMAPGIRYAVNDDVYAMAPRGLPLFPTGKEYVTHGLEVLKPAVLDGMPDYLEPDEILSLTDAEVFSRGRRAGLLLGNVGVRRTLENDGRYFGRFIGRHPFLVPHVDLGRMSSLSAAGHRRLVEASQELLQQSLQLGPIQVVRFAPPGPA